MFYLVYSVFYLISLLPLPILYIITDGFYLLIYYVFGYRKKVVFANLAIAFPEKTPGERTRIAKKFYRNFTDNIAEIIKLFSGGPAFAKRHFTLDTGGTEELYKQGIQCQVHLGHNFNWELGLMAIPYLTSYPFLCVYLPVTSKVFNQIFLYQRKRGGAVMIPAPDMKNAMLPFRYTQYLLTLVADQSPGNVQASYWLNFFGRKTAFLRGPERGARIGKRAVVFAEIYKERRGHYKCTFTIQTSNAAELPEGEITRRYARYMETVIRRHPDQWLWSHRRWKLGWKEEYRKMWIDENDAAQ